MKTKFPFRIHRSLQILAAATALIVGTLPADAAAYIKFDGVDGESTQKDHKNWCNVAAINMGGLRAGGSSGSGSGSGTGTGTGTGTGAGKVAFKEFTVSKKTDRSSPKLMEAVCIGKVFPKVQLHLTEEDAAGEETYYIIELENVLVTSYSLGGSASSAPTEEMSLNYERIKVIHVDRAGNAGNVEFEWKVEEGES